jgi:hypothetical protein
MREKLTGYRRQAAVIVLLLPVAYCLVPTITYAQECIDDNPCIENTYYTDETTNECIHKHGGFCNLDTSECEYAYDLEEDKDKCSVPEPTEEPTPSPSSPTQTNPNAPAPEEQAIYNQSQGLLPFGDGKAVSCELNLFQQLITAIFKIQFCNTEEFVNQSKSLHQSQLPFTPTGNDQQKIESYIINSYGAELPIRKDTAKETEELYEQSNFPVEIKPIIGYK